MIYDDIMEELKNRHVYKYEIYAPYFIASVATHWFNLYNQKKKIYYEAGEVPSLRAHLLFVAPPGYMKSFFMSQFLRGENSILRNTGLNFGFEKYMTGAGFVGQIKERMGAPEIHYGAAYDYADGIIGVDEFAGIVDAFDTQHGGDLKNQLLSALDTGFVEKRVGMGEIKYQTQCTLWAGTQPTRIDISSGLGRRFLYLLFIPSKKEVDELLDAWWKSKNVKSNQQDLEKLRRKITAFSNAINLIKSVEFSDDVLRIYRKYNIAPYEGSYFDRLLIGYFLSKYGVDEHITICIESNDMKDLVKQQVEWRRMIKFGADLIQVIKVIKNDGTDNKMPLEEIYLFSDKIGETPETINNYIMKLRRYGVIRVDDGVVEIVKDIWSVDDE